MKVGTFNSGGWRGFSIDIEDGPFKDVNVRRAIAYSIDKATITEAPHVESWSGARGPATAPLHPRAAAEGRDRRGHQEGADVPVQRRQGEGRAREVRRTRRASTRRSTSRPAQRRSCCSRRCSSRARAKIGINIEAEPDAGAAAVPGHPRPQAEPRDPGTRPGAGLAAPDGQARPALPAARRRLPGYENSANYKNATVDKLIDAGPRRVRPQGRRAERAHDHAVRQPRPAVHPGLLDPGRVGRGARLEVQVVARAVLLQPDVAEPPRCQVVS